LDVAAKLKPKKWSMIPFLSVRFESNVDDSAAHNTMLTQKAALPVSLVSETDV
jgi:hypothetical protein